MNINILDTKFKHHSIFKGSNLTKRQVIEYFASSDEFRLDKIPAKIQSTNLFDPVVYEPILIYCGKRKSTYKLTEEEKEYYLERRKFWLTFKDKINQEWENWGKNENYLKWLDYEIEQRMAVKEYADYMNAYKKIS